MYIDIDIYVYICAWQAHRLAVTAKSSWKRNRKNGSAGKHIHVPVVSLLCFMLMHTLGNIKRQHQKASPVHVRDDPMNRTQHEQCF